MFTGIVEGVGKLLQLKIHKKSAVIRVQPPFSLRGVKLGDSIAVNGCCLTVVAKSKKTFDADLSHETLRVTNLGKLRVGDPVNVERPLRLGDRLGGHLVMGHVDGVGTIASIKHVGENSEIGISIPKKLRKYIIPKGSITIDGISMTVNDLTSTQLKLYVIPHTLKYTNLKDRRVDDAVNIEVDLVGKYIKKLCSK